MRDQSFFLSREWQEFEQSLAFIPDVLLVTDYEGVIELCSPSATMLLKVPAGELENRSLLEFIAPEDQAQVENRIAELSSLRGIGRWDARILPRDGPSLTAEFRMSPNRNFSSNGDSGVFWLIRDISQRKFIEDRLRLSERLATLGTFASNMAHELNNPLASLLLTARHALRSLDKTDVISSCLKDIIADSERCAEIIRKQRIFAKKQYSQKIVMDLNALVRHVQSILQNIATESGVNVNFRLSNDELPVACSPVGLEQALTALIASILRNSPPNSQVSVESDSANDKHRIIVESLSPQKAKLASQARFTRHVAVNPADFSSSGMGLITAYGIIHEHQGELLSDSSGDGQHSTCIQFPTAQKADPELAEQITKT